MSTELSFLRKIKTFIRIKERNEKFDLKDFNSTVVNG